MAKGVFKKSFVCMFIVMTPLITFALAGFMVGAPLPGNEAAYIAAVPEALFYALLISVPISLVTAACASLNY